MTISVRTALSLLVAATLAGAACTGSTDDGEPEQTNTGASEPVEVTAPSGFTIHRGEEYGFVWPSDWTPVPGGGTYVAGAEMEVVGPEGELGLAPLITLYREEGFQGDFQRYLFTFNAEAAIALPNRSVIRDEPAPVPQSVEARVIESEYTLPGLVAEPEPTEKMLKKEPTDKKNNEKDKRKATKEAETDRAGTAADEEESDEAQEPALPPGSVIIRQVDVLVLTRDKVTINLRAAAPAEEFDEFSEIFTTVITSLRVRPPSVGDA